MRTEGAREHVAASVVVRAELQVALGRHEHREVDVDVVAEQIECPWLVLHALVRQQAGAEFDRRFVPFAPVHEVAVAVREHGPQRVLVVRRAILVASVGVARCVVADRAASRLLRRQPVAFSRAGRAAVADFAELAVVEPRILCRSGRGDEAGDENETSVVILHTP